MNIRKTQWIARLTPIHKHFSNKVYSKIGTKISNLMQSLKTRSEAHKGSVFNITRDELETKLYEAYGKPCPYCGKQLKVNKANGMVCDHIIPLVAGGDSSNRNLQFICKICNTRKDVLSHSDFRALLDWLGTQSDNLRLHVLGKLSKKRF